MGEAFKGGMDMESFEIDEAEGLNDAGGVGGEHFVVSLNCAEDEVIDRHEGVSDLLIDNFAVFRWEWVALGILWLGIGGMGTISEIIIFYYGFRSWASSRRKGLRTDVAWKLLVIGVRWKAGKKPYSERL